MDHNESTPPVPKVVKYNIFKSPYYASRGILTAFKQEPNLSIQILIGISFALLGISTEHWISAMGNLILMSMVISLEILNTAIETICDLVHPDFHPKVKIIKDMAAGSVLIVALSWLILLCYMIISIFFISVPEIIPRI